jgi:hypothetical protein
MPKLKDNQVPSYRLHEQSGQAVVTLNGRNVLLGPHDSRERRDKYHRVTAEWLANGRQLPTPRQAVKVLTRIPAFWNHAQTYYRKPDGTQTSEVGIYHELLGHLRRLYGDTLAVDFGPLSLKALRGEMIRLGWCRTNINKQVNRIKHVFKWGVENELAPPVVYQGLSAVAGLRAGRSEARETALIDGIDVPRVSQHVWTYNEENGHGRAGYREGRLPGGPHHDPPRPVHPR